MSRGIQAFKQTDITKAIRGAQNAGLDVHRFEIDRAGKIVIIAGQTDAPKFIGEPERIAG
jgi:hypothetical protein